MNLTFWTLGWHVFMITFNHLQIVLLLRWSHLCVTVLQVVGCSILTPWPRTHTHGQWGKLCLHHSCILNEGLTLSSRFIQVLTKFLIKSCICKKTFNSHVWKFTVSLLWTQYGTMLDSVPVDTPIPVYVRAEWWETGNHRPLQQSLLYFSSCVLCQK